MPLSKSGRSSLTEADTARRTAIKEELDEKSGFDHEGGHEEHEAYNLKYPNPSWPS